MAEINNSHIIRQGNTLWNIAKQNGTTVEELLKLNPQLKGQERRLKIGDEIILPGKKPSGMGTTVEHKPQQPTDTDRQTRAREAARKKTEEIAAMKKQSQTKPEPAGRKELSQNQPATGASKSTLDMVQKEMNRKGVPDGNPKYRSAEEWSSMIEKVSSEYGIPKEILTAHVSKEVTFKKNLVSKGQYGCMQITRSAVNSMFPGAPGNWHDIFKELDPKLLNDILYKKDANGNMVKRYSSSSELLRACKNDEMSLKVGALYDEMLYAWGAALKRYGVRNKQGKLVVSKENILRTIRELKEKPIQPKENIANIRTMATKFNGSPKYGKAITDSIISMGFDPNQSMFFKKT